MAKTVEMVMQQNRTLRTTRGHTIRFRKNEPRTIPREVMDEAMRFGAVPTEEANVPSEPDPTPDTGPTTVEERRQVIKDGIRKLRERKGRQDFNASGRPTMDKLREVTGLSDMHAQERDAAHDELKAELLEEQG